MTDYESTENAEEDCDKSFRRRIESALSTVRAWEEDDALLARCRAQIPKTLFQSNNNSHHGDATFVSALAKHVQTKCTWMHRPPCVSCGSTTDYKDESTTVRGPVTDEERDGGAQRVEVYVCETCPSRPTTCFPRYNRPGKLLDTHQGRCGEYANLFGLYCRSVGLETRYILDVTDHVWVEVWLVSEGMWTMVDACEGVVGEPSMYERGWGKKLSYNLAVSTTRVTDVTATYTRQYHSDDMQARRRGITSSQEAGERIVQSINQELWKSLDSKEAQQMKRQQTIEEATLKQLSYAKLWDDDGCGGTYQHGRISGAAEWKATRGESGENGNTSTPEIIANQALQLHVETFYVSESSLTIVLTPPSEILKFRADNSSIVVNGVSCALGRHLSVIVMDETIPGCILQSRAFKTAGALASFVETLPANRILVANGVLTRRKDGSNEEGTNDDSEYAAAVKVLVRQVGAFDGDWLNDKDGFFFVGQVLAKPDWAFGCCLREAPKGVLLHATAESLSSDKLTSKPMLRLRTLPNVRPARIAQRLPEQAMPLATQRRAGHEQKRNCFLSYIANQKDNDCIGYTTKEGAPVYVLSRSAYPLSIDSSDNTVENAWSTFLMLPDKLVADEDAGIREKDVAAPQFEVPLASDFFERSLGPQLLVGKDLIATSNALRNTRLVALYFSAHWCGPCRSFTPVLAELYSVLKDAFPSHGLEIVFVSSDRDAASFQGYFRSMPWRAVPFENLPMYKQQLSATYSVRGIPSLVILDSMTGQIVVPNTQTRQQIMQAGSRGDQAMLSMFQNDWLDQCPTESKEMLQMLELSCNDNNGADKASASIPSAKLQAYLTREEVQEREDRINTLVFQLMEDGMEQEDAVEAAMAVEAVSTDEPEQSMPLQAGPLDGVFQSAILPNQSEEVKYSGTFHANLIEQESGTVCVTSILALLLKFIANCAKAPWTSKYRRFKLSNKAVDRIITGVHGGLALLESLGFEVHGHADDFVGCIPVSTNLDAMRETIESLAKQFSERP